MIQYSLRLNCLKKEIRDNYEVEGHMPYCACSDQTATRGQRGRLFQGQESGDKHAWGSSCRALELFQKPLKRDCSGRGEKKSLRENIYIPTLLQSMKSKGASLPIESYVSSIRLAISYSSIPDISLRWLKMVKQLTSVCGDRLNPRLLFTESNS